jgi:hypothetical protein
MVLVEFNGNQIFTTVALVGLSTAIDNQINTLSDFQAIYGANSLTWEGQIVG